MKITLFNVTAFSIFYLLFSYSSIAQLTVLDPQRNWQTDKGSIENLEYEVRPKGLFAEVKLFFDVTARGSSLENHSDPLEFVYDFRMPKDAIFNDSWLYIDSYISVAEVHDRSSGTEIYESIVDRRQDPSILTKHTSSRYSLRIYPLVSDSTRRVMLSYYLPIELKEEEAAIFLPTDLIHQSVEQPQNISVKIFNDINWQYETISHPGVQVLEENASFIEYKYTGEIPFLQATYTSIIPESNLIFGTYEDADNGYFQMMYNPDIEIEFKEDYNLFIIDYEEEHTNYSQEEILAALKQQLLSAPKEFYFNIMLFDFGTHLASADWILSTEENINQLFAENIPSAFSERSKLDILIPEGIKLVEQLEKNTAICVISSSNEFIGKEEADTFVNEVSEYTDMLENNISISVIDYANENRLVSFHNGKLYTGNEYLYGKLTALTQGFLYDVSEGDLISQGLDEFMAYKDVVADAYDFDVELTGGFSYDIRILNEFNTLKLDSDNILIGKYHGSYPFEIELSGIYDGKLFSETLIVEEPNLLDLDQSARRNSFGRFLMENEFSSHQDIVEEVVEISKREKLLCAQTVFLCLEPDDLTVGSGEGDGNSTATADDFEDQNKALKVYPNPFTTQLTIELDSQSFDSEVVLELYTLDGQLIDREIRTNLGSPDELIYAFNGMEDLPSGLYVLRLTLEGRSYNIKVSHF